MAYASPSSLDVAVVGAGIAGLAAGIALKRAGHYSNVVIYERSLFKNEIGAAITPTPNANRILDRWGFDAKAYGETDKLQVRVVDAQSLDVDFQLGFTNVRDEYGHNFNAFNRVDLHRGLRELAEEVGVQVQLGKEVTDLVCDEGCLKSRDGSEAKHDLVVVADGLRSSLAKTVTGLDIKPQKLGKSVFRGLVPMRHLKKNPLIWRTSKAKSVASTPVNTKAS
ncbi:putative FAD-binding domain, FAD/NAD(P)-binding domain superfamily [Septoria linicola]|nr:putative FAD-binding domain, FAD/NAD(P)-binding domain superfamily [Septoria linicola]